MTDVELACGACTVCCQSEVVFRHPVEDQDSRLAWEACAPVEVGGFIMSQSLPRRPDGACIHLGPAGCTVYADRPHICRTFDCAVVWIHQRLIERIGGGIVEPILLQAAKRQADLRGLERAA